MSARPTSGVVVGTKSRSDIEGALLGDTSVTSVVVIAGRRRDPIFIVPVLLRSGGRLKAQLATHFRPNPPAGWSAVVWPP
jgi:hypothetical protein